MELEGGVKVINIEYHTNIDTYIGNFIERRVAAKTEVGAGNVVTNRCRDSYYRYAELRVVRPSLCEHYNTVKCLQNTSPIRSLMSPTTCLAHITVWWSHQWYLPTTHIHCFLQTISWDKPKTSQAFYTHYNELQPCCNQAVIKVIHLWPFSRQILLMLPYGQQNYDLFMGPSFSMI